ncbi:hypothetical protein ACJDT4_11235 [Clostridium neuense]|uniref:Uncharacterized protein n=1 Tax=Clostridium neuense TaxID=1728934 RepID=A0ABW8TFA3_9CLOT
MDKLQKYKKIRYRLECAASIISYIIGMSISSALGIHSQKFISLDSAITLGIILAICIILNSIAVKIADDWYAKNMNK